MRESRAELKLLLLRFSGMSNSRINRSIGECLDLPIQGCKIQMPTTSVAELKIPKACNYVGKKPPGQFVCGRCGRSYMRKDSLQRHVHWECGKEPQFQCPFCPQRCKRKAHWIRHIDRQHRKMAGQMKAYLFSYMPKIEIDWFWSIWHLSKKRSLSIGSCDKHARIMFDERSDKEKFVQGCYSYSQVIQVWRIKLLEYSFLKIRRKISYICVYFRITHISEISIAF